ncbi:MAG: DUF1328 domain-containing protein [Ottowia sp.]|nr:hypothetical protein [Ottowia sp.]
MKAVSRIFLIGAFVAGSLGFAGAAQADSDVSWSLTLGSPGMALGVVQGGPIYYGAPVYVQPRPVYRTYGPRYRPHRHHYRSQRRHYRPHRHDYRSHHRHRHGQGHRHGHWNR